MARWEPGSSIFEEKCHGRCCERLDWLGYENPNYAQGPRRKGLILPNLKL